MPNTPYALTKKGSTIYHPTDDRGNALCHTFDASHGRDHGVIKIDEPDSELCDVFTECRNCQRNMANDGAGAKTRHDLVNELRDRLQISGDRSRDNLSKSEVRQMIDRLEEESVNTDA